MMMMMMMMKMKMKMMKMKMKMKMMKMKMMITMVVMLTTMLLLTLMMNQYLLYFVGLQLQFSLQYKRSLRPSSARSYQGHQKGAGLLLVQLDPLLRINNECTK